MIWKPIGEVDAYEGLVGLGILVFVVGILLVINRKIDLFFREEKSFLLQCRVDRDALC